MNRLAHFDLEQVDVERAVEVPRNELIRLYTRGVVVRLLVQDPQRDGLLVHQREAGGGLGEHSSGRVSNDDGNAVIGVGGDVLERTFHRGPTPA